MATETKNIADLVKSCFSAFNSLSRSLTTRTTKSVAVGTWEDEAGRLRVWSGNLAAHQTGSASLSYRLRHAPSIKDEVIETLDVLLEALKEVIGILDDDDLDIDEEYVEELYEDVADSIEGLFRLTTIIRNPSRRDQLLERSNLDKTMEPFDKDYVRNKLHAASDTLVDRLGRANTQRRANFRYLLRRHEKFSQGLDDTDQNQGDTKSKMSSAIATEFIAPSDIVSAGRLDNEDAFSVGISETSYASSFFTETSRRFPTKPQPTTNDGRFECPLCFYLIKADNIAAWRKHILVDLQPYVCLIQDCSYSSKLFSGRREWFTHQSRQHTRPTGDFTECPLCKQNVSSSGAEKHLGRHLEDIALFTLPPSLFDDDEEDEADMGDDSNDNISELGPDGVQQAAELTQHTEQSPVQDEVRTEKRTSIFSKDETRQGDKHTEWDSSEAEQDSTEEPRNLPSTLQRRDIPAKAQAISPDNIDDIIATLSQMNIEQPTTSSGNTNLISKFTRSRRPGSPEPMTSVDPVNEDTQTNAIASSNAAAKPDANPPFFSSRSFEVIPYNEEYRRAILGEQRRPVRTFEEHRVPKLKDLPSGSVPTQAQPRNIQTSKTWSDWRDRTGDESE